MLSVRARPLLAVATLKQREAPELHRSKEKILHPQESVQGAWPQACRVVLSTVAACCLVCSSPIGWQLVRFQQRKDIVALMVSEDPSTK